MTPGPLVLIDGDTIGRGRTGDESYTINLLRELPEAAPELSRALLAPGRFLVSADRLEAVVGFLGFQAVRTLPVDAFPDVTPVQVPASLRST